LKQLQIHIATIEKKMEVERVQMEAKFEEKLGDERVKIVKLEEKLIKLKEKLEDEHAERRNQIAAEKTERIERMNDFADRADDLEGWVMTKNPEYLDRIRLRALLDHGQAALAKFIGCIPPSLGSEPVSISRMSQAWRSKLDHPDSKSDKDRLAVAITLLSACSIIPDPIRKLMQDDNTMRVLTEKGSNVRRLGNNTAHMLVDVEALKKIVDRSTFKKADKEGMLGILGFVQSLPV